MEELKVYIRRVMLWEFKDNENATETAKKIRNVHGQRVITGRHVPNWFLKFYSVDKSLRNEPKSGCSSDINQDA